MKLFSLSLIVLSSMTNFTANAADQDSVLNKPWTYAKDLGYQNAEYIYQLIQSKEAEAPELAESKEDSSSHNGVKKSTVETTKVFYKIHRNLFEREKDSEDAMVCTRSEWKRVQTDPVVDHSTNKPTYKETVNQSVNYNCKHVYTHHMPLPSDAELVAMKADKRF